MRAVLGGSAPEVAPRLLGARITASIAGEDVSAVITEVEAYTEDDPASHSRSGPNRRNASMFSDPGTLYVYRAYGIHWCANVVTGPGGEGSAILIRAGEILAGREAAIRRRGRGDHLADGPGKLAQALGITGDHDGLDLLDPRSPIRLHPGPSLAGTATVRVGITRAVDRRWRWVATQPVTSQDSEAERHDDD